MKKRWKKVLSVLMVGTVMVGSLTACGGDKEEKGGKSSDVKVAIICSSAGQNDCHFHITAFSALFFLVSPTCCKASYHYRSDH